MLCLLLLAAVLAAYSNHFHNDFHFDDSPAIQHNPAIRDPRMIPRFFVDPKLFSAKPEQRMYRPVTTASLALDYWLGDGLNLFFFHLSTFLWYAVQLVLMFLFFGRIMDHADPHPSNVWTALAAVAVFGLHPASAETVNYIIQRADLYNALGCVASLWLFIRYPSQRKFGWYLLPALAAMLAKPPALIFPLLLLAYALLFEQDGALTVFPWVEHRKKWGGAIRSALPALAVAGAVACLLLCMRVGTWGNRVASPFLYRITQPWVALHYFKAFFLPTELNVDPGWHYLAGPFSPQALEGYLFSLGLLGVAIIASRTRCAKPVAFGILWFFVTLLPTSLMPLPDVANDHRMFFAFVGLTLAVCWSLRMALFRVTDRLTAKPLWTYGAVSVVAALLVLAGLATRERNRVWFTEESLWRDATLKNPRNARAWINYGIVFLKEGDYEAAVSLFERGAAVDPTWPICEANLVRVYVKLNRDEVAERHLQRLVDLEPTIPDPYIAYGDWLRREGRLAQSGRPLERAARLYPRSPELRPILLQYYMERDAADRIAALKALDANQDLILSPWELDTAPAALATLDKNGDGKLSAEECGAHFGDEAHLSAAFLQRARKEFMRSQPILDALDANHDGEISAAEIRNAERELLVLDTNGDGQLEPHEMVPRHVAAAVRSVLAALDQNHDGSIDAKERSGKAGELFRDLLDAADVDGDGVVTLDELTNEIYYRADLDKDGVVTPAELDEAIRSGVLGPIALQPHISRPRSSHGIVPKGQ
ncbi:MAG: tetratricopeptide repeat protein [Bryobacteraceae bacterium]